jgi:hypothetical protein
VLRLANSIHVLAPLPIFWDQFSLLYLTATGFLLIFGIAGLLAQELIGFIDFMVCSLNLENTTYNVLTALQAAPTFDGTQIYSHLLLANLISCS